MGWKGTKHLSREKAIKLIEDRLYDATNEELGDALESLGYGDDPNLKYIGCNFTVTNGDTRED